MYIYDMKEEWKQLPGFEDYLYSSFGRCKSLPRILRPNNNPYMSKEKILKPSTSREYLCYVLWKGKERININAHRMVAKLFILNPNNLPQVNHIDGNKRNNKANNLEWMTQKQNTNHAIKKGLIKKNSINSRFIKVKKQTNGTTIR